MRTEKEKMQAGELYDPADELLARERLRARTLCHQINSLDPRESARLRELLATLLGAETGACINPPFFCDYGYNIELRPNAYFNVGCVVLDVVRVTIGRNALFGPGVQVYAASHPMRGEERRSGLEFGKPVAIGDDVWIGGNAIICPGVTVGSGTVVGAGSVVTRNLPEGVFAAGNPCRIIRQL